MNPHTPTDNDYLFRSTRHRQEVQTTTGPASWLNAPRDGFTAMQNAKRSSLSNSREGRQVSSIGIIVGHVKSAGRL